MTAEQGRISDDTPVDEHTRQQVADDIHYSLGLAFRRYINFPEEYEVDWLEAVVNNTLKISHHNIVDKSTQQLVVRGIDITFTEQHPGKNPKVYHNSVGAVDRALKFMNGLVPL